MHALRGETVPADTVDHIRPHRGDPVLFWDYGNLQSVCKACHDGILQKLEKGGDFERETGLDGWPIEPSDAMVEIRKAKQPKAYNEG